MPENGGAKTGIFDVFSINSEKICPISDIQCRYRTMTIDTDNFHSDADCINLIAIDDYPANNLSRFLDSEKSINAGRFRKILKKN
jgi:hypothetical protein